MSFIMLVIRSNNFHVFIEMHQSSIALDSPVNVKMIWNFIHHKLVAAMANDPSNSGPIQSVCIFK